MFILVILLLCVEYCCLVACVAVTAVHLTSSTPRSLLVILVFQKHLALFLLQTLQGSYLPQAAASVFETLAEFDALVQHKRSPNPISKRVSKMLLYIPNS